MFNTLKFLFGKSKRFILMLRLRLSLNVLAKLVRKLANKINGRLGIRNIKCITFMSNSFEEFSFIK